MTDTDKAAVTIVMPSGQVFRATGVGPVSPEDRAIIARHVNDAIAAGKAIVLGGEWAVGQVSPPGFAHREEFNGYAIEHRAPTLEGLRAMLPPPVLKTAPGLSGEQVAALQAEFERVYGASRNKTAPMPWPTPAEPSNATPPAPTSITVVDDIDATRWSTFLADDIRRHYAPEVADALLADAPTVVGGRADG